MRDLKPEILFEDQHLVVLSKPAGLLSQGEHTESENLVDYLRQHFGRNYVGLIHRLDRNTSGLMVVAKRSKAATRLTESLKAGNIYRSYLAWVRGDLKEQTRWKHYLWKDQKTNQVHVVAPSHPQGKVAILLAKPVGHGIYESDRLTLVEFELETGRSHQIRVQAAHEKFPILGDRKYGTSSHESFSRPALHSYRLHFPHPMTNDKYQFEDELPKDMAQIKIIP